MIRAAAILALTGLTAVAASVPPQSASLPVESTTETADDSAIGGNAPAGLNVNSKYTVESVEITPPSQRLSTRLRERMQDLVGTRFDQETFDSVTNWIRRELRDRVVSMRIAKGTHQEQVRVIFETTRKHDRVDAGVPRRLVYHSRQNFSFGGDLRFHRGANTFSFGALTDNDQLSERFSGAALGYSRDRIGSDRLRAGIDFEAFRTQWNGAVLSTVPVTESVPGLYRERINIQPTVTIALSRDLTLQLGVSMQRVEVQLASTRHELSSAALSTLRFRRRWEASNLGRHEIGANYGLRASARSLSSDYVYSRHLLEADYSFKTDGHDSFTARFQSGQVNGRAPLFERFVLGNSVTLRGWNKFDLAPFGADRVAHGSFEYRHRWFRTIYDTGSVWQRGGGARLRHSVAIGIAQNSLMGLTFLVAFPLREGRVEPVFMTGINF